MARRADPAAPPVAGAKDARGAAPPTTPGTSVPGPPAPAFPSGSGTSGARRGFLRPRVVVAVAVIVGALGWIVFAALRSNLAYYRTPTDVAGEGSAAVGQSIRLGGLVQPGSLCAQGRTVRFVVTDLRTELGVVTSSAVPQLFAEGRGIVAEGRLEGDGLFHADDILVKHNDVYTPPRTGPIPHAAAPACG
jgi:cytochrome c-type biogenesis protein CcmE